MNPFVDLVLNVVSKEDTFVQLTSASSLEANTVCPKILSLSSNVEQTPLKWNASLAT